MALKTIVPDQFDTVCNLLTDETTLFIIPSFQRPYTHGSLIFEGKSEI